MNKFHFKYQSLLGVKEKHEERIQGKLSTALKRLEDEKQRLMEYEKTKEVYQYMIHAKIQEGTALTAIRVCDMYIRSLDKKIFHQMQTVEKCNRDVNQLRADLLKASQERKTFEKLKEKELDIFSYKEKREEEKFVDQLVTFKNYKSN
ncbi:flagellar export protein FliJ [Thermotalea metallivorans]|uniref:Flagellar FliJ protein n=1 Tax=Thermotalea metallivorans TaxID=520762 RepID=A0A140L5C2_9FIRM|nr:flagellar export protein FliJ [Thermotalea metallivorans]KXG75747.1 Flagellar FliJ protein [Thermotalea metallivorans]